MKRIDLPNGEYATEERIESGVVYTYRRKQRPALEWSDFVGLLFAVAMLWMAALFA